MAGMDQLSLIARKGRHVIDEDQCVDTAFLMQGFAWVDARGDCQVAMSPIGAKAASRNRVA
jgi:hypothetical protein